MSLEILWFALIAAFWAVFLFLEGFDFGIGILQFFLGKNERERGTYIASIGPHWNGNEVWLITAVGATFAAFPSWYATLFSAFYLPFVVLLLALIVRGVCFEFRHRADYSAGLRLICDAALMASSFVPALLIGVVMANFIIGIPINESGNFTGVLYDLFKPFALFAGALGCSLFLTGGALFLTLKIEGELQERACRLSKFLAVLSALLFAIMTALVLKHSAICIIPFILLHASTVFTFKRHFKTALTLLGLCIAISVAALFYAMFPNVLVSTIAENSLTIWNCASAKYTLKIMSIAACVLVPVVIAYQIWSYYVFRKRITSRSVNIEA
jgi:cytochrome d ubiquinol oxidase subunit II